MGCGGAGRPEGGRWGQRRGGRRSAGGRWRWRGGGGAAGRCIATGAWRWGRPGCSAGGGASRRRRDLQERERAPPLCSGQRPTRHRGQAKINRGTAGQGEGLHSAGGGTGPVLSATLPRVSPELKRDDQVARRAGTRAEAQSERARGLLRLFGTWRLWRLRYSGVCLPRRGAGGMKAEGVCPVCGGGGGIQLQKRQMQTRGNALHSQA